MTFNTLMMILTTLENETLTTLATLGEEILKTLMIMEKVL